MSINTILTEIERRNQIYRVSGEYVDADRRLPGTPQSWDNLALATYLASVYGPPTREVEASLLVAVGLATPAVLFLVTNGVLALRQIFS